VKKQKNLEFGYLQPSGGNSSKEEYKFFTLTSPLGLTYKSRDSSVGIALGHGLDDRVSRIPFPAAGTGNFSLHHHVQNGSGAQWVPGALSLGVERPGREADHSPPSSAEVKE
jgi:hypothetical protein